MSVEIEYKDNNKKPNVKVESVLFWRSSLSDCIYKLAYIGAKGYIAMSLNSIGGDWTGFKPTAEEATESLVPIVNCKITIENLGE